MNKYTKIETLYKRSEEGRHELLEGVFRDPTVEFLKDLEWVGTEKIDGTNIGVVWDGHSVSFQGRTERAEIPKPLLETLKIKFCGNEMEEMFEQIFGEANVILFGEGYGHKIQKVGDCYLKDSNDFILFDVYFPNANIWSNRKCIEYIANTLGIKVVPIIFRGTIDEAVEYVKSKPNSTIGDCTIEGIVCKPKIDLLDRNGDRLIVKIKVCDFCK